MTEAHRPLPRLLGLLALLTLLVISPAILAEEQTSPPESTETASSGKHAVAPSSEKPDVLRLPPTSITYHTLDLGNEQLSYRATAGAVSLRDAQGKLDAEIFYVAYDREPADTKRPVTFVFNGGPGAASAYLHLGALGPKIVDTSARGEVLGPPPRLMENKDSWLAFTDLVFVDPVGTGYSRIGDGKVEKDFWGVAQDTEALADFIRLYLIEAGRMVSPVFLTGESYGGFRVATITRKLQKTGGISPSGLVLVSPALDFALLDARFYDPLRWALILPSYAAVNLESEGITGREALASALKDAEQYALSDFLVALASGAEEGGKTASGTVAKLAGLPLDVVEKHRARIPPWLFIKEFARSHGQVLSRYDGSVSGPDPSPASTWPRGPDPVLDSTVPLWSSAFVQYAQDELAYKSDQTYRLLNREVRGKWDFGTSSTQQGFADVLDDIQQARAANRALEILIATGYTDLITPYLVPTYLVSQLAPLDGAAPITVEDYAGGHMLYLRADSRRAFKEDVEAMYGRALKSQPQG